MSESEEKQMDGRFSRVFRRVFPRWALARSINSHKLRMLDRLAQRSGSFEATSGGRTRYDFLTNSKAPDSAIVGDIAGLRNHVRHLEFNNGMVAGVIRRIRNNVVGKGFTLQSTVKADEVKPGMVEETPRISDDTAENLNHYTEKYFGIWSKEADLQMMRMFHEICGLGEMGLVRDGEAVVVARESRRPGRLIPYCLQGFEPDRLDTPMSELNNPRIRHGIEYDEEGVPRIYYLLRQHPGESYLTAFQRNDFEEVPAFFPNGRKKVFHLYDPIRFEQSRGFSELAAGLKSLQDADRYKDAVKFASLMAACSVATRKSNNPQGSVSALANTDSSNNKIFEFAPGAIWELGRHEEISWNDPKQPTTAFSDFMAELMKDPAGALDVPPVVLTQDWAGMNYSNARTVLLQFYLNCALRQFYLINHLCDPVYEGVFYSLVATGKLNLPGFDKRPWDFMRHAWIPNGWQWVDPLKESKAAENDVENGFSDPYQINSSRGQDADEVLERKARYLKKKKELEKKYDIKFPEKAGSQAAADPDNEDDETTPGKDKKNAGRTVFLQSVSAR